MTAVSIWNFLSVLRNLQIQVAELNARTGALEMTTQENATAIGSLVQSIKASIAGIQGDIATLKAQIGTGMSQADVDSVVAQLTTIQTTLADLDAQTPATPATPPSE